MYKFVKIILIYFRVPSPTGFAVFDKLLVFNQTCQMLFDCIKFVPVNADNSDIIPLSFVSKTFIIFADISGKSKFERI